MTSEKETAQVPHTPADISHLYMIGCQEGWDNYKDTAQMIARLKHKR